jgi:hypothetical protein
MKRAMVRVTLIFASLIVPELLSTGQATSAFNPENARGIWYCDEGRGNVVTKDASGNGNDGSYHGGEKWVPGKSGNALRFDGEDDQLNLGTDESLNPTSELTIVAWIYVERYTAIGGPERTFFQRADSFRFAVLSADAGKEGVVRFGLGPGNPVIDSVDVVPLKEWHHVAATYDGTIAKLYLDGRIAAEKRLNKKIPGSKGEEAHTTIASGHNGRYKGIIDEVALFDRVLRAVEVSRIVNEGLKQVIFAVSPLDKLATTWGTIKQSK